MTNTLISPVSTVEQKRPILEVHGIVKTFGAVQALRGVDFEVYTGEVMGLVVDNGSGKSTLIKIIAGVYQADSGQIFMYGKPISVPNPAAANALGIETVYQDLALCDNLDVVANLFLGREKHHKFLPFLHALNDIEMERRTREVLDTLNIEIPSLHVAVASLSGGQRQSVAVAKTILQKSKVVLLDEPTAALGVAQTRQVLNLIRRLREKGLAVVVISHNLHDVFEVVDRVTVLRLGKRVGVYDIKSTTPEQIVSTITGATFGNVPELDKGLALVATTH